MNSRQSAISLQVGLGPSPAHTDRRGRPPLRPAGRAITERRGLNARFDNYCLSRFGAYENIVDDFAAGFIEDDDYDVWAGHFKYRFDKPGYRQFWIEYRSQYFANFRAWADEQFGISVD